MNLKRSILLMGGAALMTAACLAPSHWENPRHPEADWEADHYFCMERAKDHTPTVASGYGSPAVGIAGEIARLDLAYKQCMNGLGWHQVPGVRTQARASTRAATLRCNDGTFSPTCTRCDDNQGCCSGHGGLWWGVSCPP